MIKLTSEQIEQLKATASFDYEVAMRAQTAFAAALEGPLRKGIFDEDNHGGIFTRELLAPGAQANYPLDFIRPGTEDLDYTAFTMPKQGKIPYRHVEGDEVWVPTYKIANAIDWLLDYAREARFSVVARALDVYKMGFVRKLNEDGWHTLLAAADARGLVVNDAVAQQGQFTKELISKMQTAMVRNAGGNGNDGQLTDLYTSMEAREDIRAWDISEIDDVTRREILQTAGRNMAVLYGTTLHFMTEFGVGQEYQNYLVTTLGRAVPALEEEFVVGLDNSTNDSFVSPVRQELITSPDPTLHRSQKAGVYGTMILGYACLDNRRLLLGTL